MTTSIQTPVADLELESVMVPVSTSWSVGTTNRLARMSPAQAERLAHSLIIAAGEVRAQRQMTTRG